MDSITKKNLLLSKIKDEVWNLKESPLYEYRTQNHFYPVIGEGNHEAHIVFVGEAPGENEAKTGRPFCGAAGKVLDELCSSIGLNRLDTYVTNIVKDRPPGNRDPNPEEIALYSPYLVRQIEIIQPDVIAPLGRFSMRFIMEKFGLEAEIASISLIHGHKFEAWADYGVLAVVPLFHPAVALYRATQKAQLIKDFQILKEYQ
jgi:uracil-DNA glycosylase